MLHSRLRPLFHSASTSTTTTAPDPDFQDEDAAQYQESPEDLFESFLPHLFPDDAPSFHGDPGQHLVYLSPVYGDFEIMVPSYPGQQQKQNAKGEQVEEGRRLFAHFLWSAAMVVAEGVEKATARTCDDEDPDIGIWDVKGENVLELGAG